MWRVWLWLGSWPLSAGFGSGGGTANTLLDELTNKRYACTGAISRPVHGSGEQRCDVASGCAVEVIGLNGAKNIMHGPADVPGTVRMDDCKARAPSKKRETSRKERKEEPL